MAAVKTRLAVLLAILSLVSAKDSFPEVYLSPSGSNTTNPLISPAKYVPSTDFVPFWIDSWIALPVDVAILPPRCMRSLPPLRLKRLSHKAFTSWLPSGHLYLQSDILMCGDVKPQPGPTTGQSRHNRLHDVEQEASSLHPNSSSHCSLNNTLSSSSTVHRFRSSTLHCFYQNVRSIKSGGKLREFQDSVYANDFDLVAITESWLTSDISDSELLPWGYDVHRCDRSSSRGGGVLIASRCNLRCSAVFLTDNSTDLEYAAIEVNTNNCGKVLFAVFYRPPSVPASWIHSFTTLLNNCRYDRVVLLGDFNLPSISWIEGSGFCDSSDSTLFTFCQTLADKNLFQLVNLPTRGDNCLDLLFTSIVEGVANVCITDCEGVAVSSDHKALTFDLHFISRSVNNNTQPSFNLNKADFEGLRSSLSEHPLESVLSPDSNDIEGSWSRWKKSFLSRIEAFIPRRKPRKFVTPPWVDGEVLHAIRKKNTVRKKAIQRDSSLLWDKFRRLRQEVKYLVRAKRVSYLQDISDTCFSSPSRFWSYFNRLTRRSSVPDSVELDNSSYSTAEEKAEAFNRYFSSVFNNDTSLPDNLPSTPFTDTTITSITLTTKEVLSALQRLDPNKTPGPDGFHPRILKECAKELAPSLCALFNKSLRLGRLPSEWKHANVTPVFKKGVKSAIPNYRPISLLSIVSKVCERCVLNQLLPSICELLSSLQHGFVSGRSCVTQLLSVLQELGAALDTGQETDVIYLDFSKAFDSVPHRRLLHKLSLFGISGSLHHWFSDYLTTRSQRVLVDGAFSPWSHVLSGVPQGSLLGPFLFLLYVNDLPDVVSPDTSIALFADDAKCSRPISGLVDHQGLQQDLNSLYDWSGVWGLSFNHKKCETMRISRKRISQAPSLKIKNKKTDSGVIPMSLSDHSLICCIV